MLQATTVANEIIRSCNDRDIEVNNLKLQKLLFFVQAYNLAEFDCPAFDDRIEAWEYGPVIPSAHQFFKTYGPDPIPKNHYFANLDEMERHLVGQDVRQSVNGILSQLGGMEAFDLVSLAQEKGSPWCIAYNEGSSGAKISNESIKDFYST